MLGCIQVGSSGCNIMGMGCDVARIMTLRYVGCRYLCQIGDFAAMLRITGIVKGYGQLNEGKRKKERKRGEGRWGLRDSGGACMLYPACVLSDFLCSYMIHRAGNGGELWNS